MSAQNEDSVLGQHISTGVLNRHISTKLTICAMEVELVKSPISAHQH